MTLQSQALDPRYRTHLRLVNADERDAAYICALRDDPLLNRHLNRSPPDVGAQLAWLKNYKIREAAGEEYYFAVVNDGVDHGLVRMYDFRELEGRRSFCWGSWIIPRPKVAGLVTYSALLIYEVGFGALGFEQCHFDVRRGNTHVIRFHEAAGARRVSEGEVDIFFRFFPEDYASFRAASQEQVAAHRVVVG